MIQVFNSLLVSLPAVLGIVLATVLFDRGLSHHMARKYAHIGAGCSLLAAFILAEEFPHGLLPLSVILLFTVGIILARLYKPFLIRGIGGSGRPNAIAEIWYPVTTALGVFVGWTLLGDPYIGILPGLFLSFGDAITGIVRALVYKREVKGLWGSAAMLVVCLILVVPIQPYYAGASAAIAATLLEYYTKTSRYIDDNLSLSVGATAVLAAFKIGGVV